MDIKNVVKNWATTKKSIYTYSARYILPNDIKGQDIAPNHWFTKKDLEKITYRTINYWDEKGYLTGVQNEGSKWRKFDFIQLIWIHLLDKCRQLGISLDSVIPVIFQSYGYIPESEEIKDAAVLNTLSKEEKTLYKEMIGAYSNFQDIFRFWATRAIFLKLPISIRYYSDGTCCTMLGKEKVMGNTSDHAIDILSYVSISLNELIREFIEHQPISILETTEVVSKDELEIIKHLRKGDLDEATIHWKDGHPITLQLKKSLRDMELAKRMYEYISSPYEKLEIKVNGDNAYGTSTKTIKLR